MAFNFERKVARPREEFTSTVNEPVEEPKVIGAREVEQAAVMEIPYFEPGTAIYKLVIERLEVLEKTIENATKEYEELAKYIKGEE